MNKDVTLPSMPPLTDEQITMVDNLLAKGAGLTLSQIADAIGLEYPELWHGSDPLEQYLLQQIALGNAERVWNNDERDHFYMATQD